MDDWVIGSPSGGVSGWVRFEGENERERGSKVESSRSLRLSLREEDDGSPVLAGLPEVLEGGLGPRARSFPLPRGCENIVKL